MEILNVYAIVNSYQGHPVEQIKSSDQITEWKVLSVVDNVTTFPRGLTPILLPHNYTHVLPLRSVSLTNGNLSKSDVTKVIMKFTLRIKFYITLIKKPLGFNKKLIRI